MCSVHGQKINLKVPQLWRHLPTPPSGRKFMGIHFHSNDAYIALLYEHVSTQSHTLGSFLVLENVAMCLLYRIACACTSHTKYTSIVLNVFCQWRVCTMNTMYTYCVECLRIALKSFRMIHVARCVARFHEYLFFFKLRK